MFKGLMFFVKQGWKYDKCYILWNVFYQFVNSMIPVIAALAPRYIIDELMGQARPQMLVLYVGLPAGYTLIAGGLSVFFSMDGFTRRCRVAAEFDSALNIVGQTFTLAGVAAIIATLDVRVVLIFLVLTGAGTFAEGRAKERAAKLTEQISADQREWMYYAGLFENFGYGKEIRLNSMGNWLLKRERAFFTRVNDNLKQQNDGYIRSGLIGCGCTFL